MKWTLKKSEIFGIIYLISYLIFFISNLIGAFIVEFYSIPIIYNQTLIIFLASTKFLMILINIGFLAGFIILGKKFNNKLLLYSAYIIILFSFLFSIGNLIFVLIDKDFNLPLINSGFFENYISGSIPFLGHLLTFLPDIASILISIIIFSLSIILTLSLGIGLYKLNIDSKLPKIAGIFEIANIITGFFGFIALILEIILFSKLSKNKNPS